VVLLRKVVREGLADYAVAVCAVALSVGDVWKRERLNRATIPTITAP
jgi:hypothetical protein